MPEDSLRQRARRISRKARMTGENPVADDNGGDSSNSDSSSTSSTQSSSNASPASTGSGAGGYESISDSRPTREEMEEIREMAEEGQRDEASDYASEASDGDEVSPDDDKYGGSGGRSTSSDDSGGDTPTRTSSSPGSSTNPSGGESGGSTNSNRSRDRVQDRIASNDPNPFTPENEGRGYESINDSRPTRDQIERAEDLGAEGKRDAASDLVSEASDDDGVAPNPNRYEETPSGRGTPGETGEGIETTGGSGGGSSGDQSGGGSNSSGNGPGETGNQSGGLETGDGRLADDAQDLENEFLNNNDRISNPDHVRVVKDNGKIRTELTPEGQRHLTKQQANKIEQQFIDQGPPARSSENVFVERRTVEKGSKWAQQEGIQAGDTILVPQLTEERRRDRQEYLQNQAETLAGISASVQYEESVSGDVERGEDYTIEQRGDRAVAIPTNTNQTQNNDARRARRRLEESLEQRTGMELTPGEDFRLREQVTSGRSPTSNELRRARQLRNAGLEQQAQAYLRSQTQPTRTLRAELSPEVERELATQQFARQNSNLEPGEDFTVEQVQNEQGETVYQAQLTQSGAKEVGRTKGDIFSGSVSAVEDALSEVAQVSGGEGTRVEFKGEGSVVNVAAAESQGSGEQFGDYLITLPGGRSVESYAEDASSTFQQDVVKPAAAAVGRGAKRRIESSTLDPMVTPTDPLYYADMAESGYDATSDVIRSQVDDDSRLQGSAQALDVMSNQLANVSGRFSRGTAEGAGAIADVPGLALTAKESTELAAYGVTETASGRGGDFATDVGEAAALRSAGAAEYISENPVRFAGQLAGSGVGSAAAVKGAQALGGARTARAASVAIQPGEELAISAARRGLISRSTATGVPGVREGNIDGNSDTSSIDIGERLSGPVRSAQQRVPDVDARVSTNPDAPRIDLNINADLQRRLVDLEQSAARAPGRIREGASDIATGARQRVSGGLDRVRNAPDSTSQLAQDISDYTRNVAQRAQPDLPSQQQVNDAAYRAGYRTQQNINRVRGNAEGRVRNLLNADSPVPSQQQVNDAAYRAGYRTQQDYNRLVGNLRGRVEDATNLDSPIPSQSDVNELAYRSGRRYQGAVNDVRDGMSIDVDSPVPSQQQVNDAAYRTGYRTQQDYNQVRTNVEERLSGEADRVGDTLRRLERDVSLPDRGTASIDDGDGQSLFGDRRGGDFTPADLAGPAIAGGSRVASAARSVRDASLRVDIGKPSRRDVSASELSIDDDVGVEFVGGQLETDDSGDVTSFTTDVEQDAGDGTVIREQQTFHDDVRGISETDARSEPTGVAVERVYAEPDMMQDELGTQFDEMVGEGIGVAETPRQTAEVQQPELGVEGVEGIEGRLETPGRAQTETPFETNIRVETPTETQTTVETGVETVLETEFENRFEPEGGEPDGPTPPSSGGGKGEAQRTTYTDEVFDSGIASVEELNKNLDFF